jgi:hypothetical protein
MAASAALATSDAADARTTCFICLDPCGSSQHLLHGGCACRGDSGFGHVACIAKAAQETNDRMWAWCPTCKQRWTGQMELGLARAAEVVSVTSLAEGAATRLGVQLFSRPRSTVSGRAWLNASNMLTQELKDMAEYAQALSLGVATLAVARWALRPEDDVTLTAMGILAVVHTKMGDPRWHCRWKPRHWPCGGVCSVTTT